MKQTGLIAESSASVAMRLNSEAVSLALEMGLRKKDLCAARERGDAESVGRLETQIDDASRRIREFHTRFQQVAREATTI